MKIEVLGTGCAKCVALENVVKEAVAKSGKFVQIEKVDEQVGGVELRKCLNGRWQSLLQRLFSR